ncbi:unnamed protein product, partial [Prorocentrum cordatum]
VWCLRPAPPFWPEPGEMGEACEDHEVGPWLDFEDMFLTSRVLMRALSELVGLLGALAGLLPEEETGGCRRRISGTAQAAGLREAAAAAAARRAPWLRASPCEAPTARQELVAPPLSEAQAALDRALWSEATALVRSSLKSRGRAARSGSCQKWPMAQGLHGLQSNPHEAQEGPKGSRVERQAGGTLDWPMSHHHYHR